MFRKSRPLIGTPNRQQTNENELEFTPIGQENGNKESTIRRPDFITGPGQKRNPLNNSPLINRVHGGSSFIADSSFDTIHQSATKATQVQAPSSSPFTKQFQNHDLLNDGSNPVKQQQENASKLQEENYNLKVKIASLTRFLNSVTNNNQQEIYQQNSELQEKLIKLRSDMSLLNQEVTRLRNSNSNSNSNSDSDANSKLNDLNTKLEQYKEEVNRLNNILGDYEFLKEEIEVVIPQRNRFEKQMKEEHQKLLDAESLIEELKQELAERDEKISNTSSPVSKAYVQRIEEQVETLRDDLEAREHDLRRKDEELEAREDEIEELEAKLKRVASEQRSESNRSNAAVESQIRELEDELKEKVDEVAKYKHALKSNGDEINSLKRNRDKLLAKLESYDEQLEDLKNSLKNSKKQNDILQDELQKVRHTENSREREELLKLKQSLANSETEMERLQSTIKHKEQIINAQKQDIEQLKVQASLISTKELNNLLDKLEFAEKKLDQVVSERDSLKRRLEAADKRYIELKDNSERTYRAYEQLKKSQDAGKSTQFDEYAIKDEIDILSKQVKDLNFQNRTLEQELQREKELGKNIIGRDSYEKQELRSLVSKCNELQLELSEKEKAADRAKVRYEKEIDNYKEVLSQKDEQISKLKKEVKSFELSTNDKLEDEKFELLRTKSSKDKEIKLLKFQLAEAKDEHESEVKYLKKQLEQFKEKNGFSKSYESEASIELQKKIENKNMKIKILSERLQNAITDLKDYEKIISRLEQSKVDLSKDNAKLLRKLSALDEELEYQLKAFKNKRDDYSENEINKMKTILLSKDKEIQEFNIEFNEMKHELLEKYHGAIDDKRNLQKRIDKLVTKYRQLQNSLNMNVNSGKQVSMLKDQSDFYKMKYTKSTYVINDLKFVNNFMVKSIQATNSHIKKDIKKLQNVGIYPDYDLIRTKKPTLSVLIKFVVAAVRIKRKTDHSSTRNKKIDTLREKLKLLDY